MKRILHFLKKCITSPPLLAAAASAVLMFFVLMVHPLIGMADNGDFFRSINGNGIYKLDRYEEDEYFKYFSSKYGLYQYYNEWEDSLISSQNVYIQAAKLLNGIFSVDKTTFDIRFLSVFLIFELVIGIYMLIDYISWNKSKVQGFLLAALGVIMFADTAYTAYFNSFYAEGINYVSFFLLVASTLLLTQRRYPPYPLLFSIIINGICLIFTKQQNATEGIPLFFLCLLLAIFLPEEKKSFRRILAGSAVLMAVVGITMYLIIPADFVRINQYQSMTRGVMLTSENPEEALESFGINRQYSVLDGLIYFEKYPPVETEGEILENHFYNKYNFVSLATYYLTNPSALVSMLDIAAGEGYKIRPDVQGNYEKSAGRLPGEQTEFFTLYSRFKSEFIPNTIGFALIWILVTCGISFRDRKKLIVVLCTIMLGVIQVGTSIVGDGDADLAKHLFLYNVAFDMVSFVCFAPFLTSTLIHIGETFFKLVRKRKAVMLTAVIVLSICGTNNVLQVHAAPKEEKQKIIIIGHQEKDTAFFRKIAECFGVDIEEIKETEYRAETLENVDYVITTSIKPMEDIRKAGISALCAGEAFTEIPGCELEKYNNRTVSFALDNYDGRKEFIKEFTIIRSFLGESIGNIRSGEEQTPFAIKAQDGNYYVPCYKEEGSAAVLMGAVMRQMLEYTKSGKTYFAIDEVYTFSDLEKLCHFADVLYENGIPFLVRIMPIYENLDYPAFKRFTQVLRYMQSQGGTIVLHEPLIEEYYTEVEPLTDKMEGLKSTLEEEGIFCREMPNSPYFFSMEEIGKIESSNPNFGVFPFDSLIGVTPEMTEGEFLSCVEQVNKKWMSFTDYQKEFESSSYGYYEKEIPEDYVYREKEEAAFAVFFNASDRFLMVVVGTSLVVLFIFLLIGRKWYRRKFYR